MSSDAVLLTAAGTLTAVGALFAFAAVTVLTMLALTLLATAGGYGLPERWLENWGNRFTAGVLIVIGALVLAGGSLTKPERGPNRRLACNP